MRYFSGHIAKDIYDIPPKSKYVSVGPIYVYSEEKNLNGFFIEELFDKIAHLLNIPNEPIFVVAKDDEHYYLIFLNDPMYRETIIYKKGKDIESEEQLSFIIENIKKDFNHVIYALLKDDHVIIKYGGIVKKIKFNKLKLTYFKSSSEIVINYIKRYGLHILTLITLTSSLIFYYKYVDKRINQYITKEEKFYNTNKKVLSKSNTKLDSDIKNKINELKNIESKKDILDDPDMFIKKVKKLYYVRKGNHLKRR